MTTNSSAAMRVPNDGVTLGISCRSKNPPSGDGGFLSNGSCFPSAFVSAQYPGFCLSLGFATSSVAGIGKMFRCASVDAPAAVPPFHDQM